MKSQCFRYKQGTVVYYTFYPVETIEYPKISLTQSQSQDSQSIVFIFDLFESN